jgi:hypothetical protein
MKLIAIILLAVTLEMSGAIILLKPASAPAQTLADHMAAQLASRTTGNGFNFIGVKTNNSTLVGFPPVVAADFWLRDVSNILASSHFYKSPTGWGVGACLSPISPRHCVATQHVTGNNGNAYLTNLWLLPDGTVYTNWIIAQTNLGGDLDVVLMAKTNCAWFQVLPDVTAKVVKNYAVGLPAVGVLMHHASLPNSYVTTFTAALTSPGQFGHTWNNFQFGDYSQGYAQITGDSSSPTFVIIAGEAVLVDQTYTAAMSGPSPGVRIAEVNAAMQNLSLMNAAPIYSATLYDLSAFPNL